MRAQFLRRLHFDLFTDMSRYDARLSNTDLIPEPTELCSKAGIRTFTPVVSAVVSYLTSQALHTPSPESVPRLQARYGTLVQQVNQQPWSFS